MAPFFYSDRIPRYSFGERHPLKPERLLRTVRLLARYGVEPTDPGPVRDDADPLLVHAPDYVAAVREIGHREALAPTVVHDGRFGYRTVGLSDDEVAFRARYGFGSLDNPPFANMHEISLDYVRASAAAAEAVASGEGLAFCIGGGLHHAMKARAAGFCLYNDLAVAATILRRRFARVAYVDIDVHHGDGVQALFAGDPTVLTASIHEDGRTLFPGTGAVEEGGASCLCVPIPARASGDVWLAAFRATVLPALERFRPEALVLQLGTDAHWLDPLGHVRCTQGDWLAAVRDLKALGLPTVAGGGGGYSLLTVPRMWTSAVLTLMGREYDDALPPDLAAEWETPTFSDPAPPDRGHGREATEAVVARVRREILPRIGHA